MTGKPGHVNDEYRKWHERVVSVAGRGLVVVSKPGVFSHGATDPSSHLLAEHMAARADDVVVLMNCGNALPGVALARAGRVLMTDRSALAVEASHRTLSANGADNSTVLLGHGNLPLARDTVADVVGIRIPIDKSALLQLLNDAFTSIAPNGSCYIAGATNEGIKSGARVMEEMFGNATTIATEAGHRVVRAIKRTDTPAGITSPFLAHDYFNELRLTRQGRDFTFSSRPGVFSWEHLDEATEVLLEHLDVNANDRVLDLGTGSGVLGVVAGSIATAHPATMLDVDSEAVRSATRSAQSAGLSNARVMASDVASAVLAEEFDLVVTNPPFHVGKSTELSVPIQFIADAFAVLAPGGRLSLVANRTLPYEGAIKFLFKNITKVHDGRRFKVLSAIKAS